MGAFLYIEVDERALHLIHFSLKDNVLDLLLDDATFSKAA